METRMRIHLSDSISSRATLSFQWISGHAGLPEMNWQTRSPSSLFGPILSSYVQCSSFEPMHRSVPFGGWYRGKEASMWSAVCFSASHLQFTKDTKPHLYIVEQNSPTAVRERFSPTQEGLGRGSFPVWGARRWNECVEARNIFAIPYFTYDLPRKLLWYWTYLGLSVVPAQPVQKSASIWVLAVV